MIQESRRDEPLYSCMVPDFSVTGNQEEELTTFGTSASAAGSQAESINKDNLEATLTKLLRPHPI